MGFYFVGNGRRLSISSLYLMCSIVVPRGFSVLKVNWANYIMFGFGVVGLSKTTYAYFYNFIALYFVPGLQIIVNWPRGPLVFGICFGMCLAEVKHIHGTMSVSSRERRILSGSPGVANL